MIFAYNICNGYSSRCKRNPTSKIRNLMYVIECDSIGKSTLATIFIVDQIYMATVHVVYQHKRQIYVSLLTDWETILQPSTMGKKFILLQYFIINIYISLFLLNIFLQVRKI